MKASVIALLPLAAWVSATGDWSNEDDCPEESSTSQPPTPSLTYVPRPTSTGTLTSTVYSTHYNTKGVVVETIVIPVSTTWCPEETTSTSSSSTSTSTPVPSSPASIPGLPPVVQPVASSVAPNPSINPYPPAGPTATTKSYGTITAPTASPSATSPVTAGAVPNVHSSGGVLAAVAGLIAAFL